MFEFLNPWFFLLIVPVLVFLLILYFNVFNKLNFWPIWDLKKVFKTNSIFYKLYFVVLFLIFLFFIWIFARPILIEEDKEIKKDWIDIQIILDISYSMLAEDLKPNRLEVAKNMIQKFVWNLKTDRVWIIIYAWKTFTSSPLSFDYNIIKKIVWKISVETINQKYNFIQWTATGDSMILAAKNFENKEKENVIILITDWEANRWIEPIIATEYIKKMGKNIKIYTIGVWWEEDATIKLKNSFWWYEELLVWWVDEESLKQIADITWWKYFRAKNNSTFQEIFDTISELEKSEIIEKKITSKKDLYFYLVLVLIFLFNILFLFKYFKKL